MKLSLATLLAVVTSVQTLSFQAGMENKFQKKVCEMLAILLILYNDNHKIYLINHKQIIIERNTKLSCNIPIFSSPKKAF